MVNLQSCYLTIFPNNQNTPLKSNSWAWRNSLRASFDMHSVYVARLLCSAGRGKLGGGHPGYHAARAVVSSQHNPLITSEVAAASKTKQSATSHRVKQVASKTPATSFTCKLFHHPLLSLTKLQNHFLKTWTWPAPLPLSRFCYRLTLVRLQFSSHQFRLFNLLAKHYWECQDKITEIYILWFVTKASLCGL